MEVRSLAIRIGVATSVANALVNPKTALANLETLIEHSPVLSFEFVEAVNYIRGLDASSQISKSLWQLMTKLRRAKVTTVEAAVKCTSPFGIPASKFMQTTLSWRASCVMAIEAIEGLKQISQHYNIEICPGPAWSRISSFLEEVAAGSHSWVMENGDINRPEWADRRLSERIPVTSHAILQVGNTAREVVLRDISVTGPRLGLGLEGVIAAEPGDKATIQLECGSMLTGKIMWVNDGMAGVEVMKSYR
jgi:hypothetical protein